jgi:hypothetical protein
LATTAFVGTALGSYAPKANPVLTGRTQSDAYSYTVVQLSSAASQTLNLSAASEWTMTITANTSIAFTNTLATNTSEVVFIRFTNAGAFTITWPANTKLQRKLRRLSLPQELTWLEFSTT